MSTGDYTTFNTASTFTTTGSSGYGQWSRNYVLMEDDPLQWITPSSSTWDTVDNETVPIVLPNIGLENAKIDNSFWVGHRSNRIIMISEMPVEHLLFAIRMCQRGHDIQGTNLPEWIKAKLPFLEDEAGKRKAGDYDDGWDI